MTPPTNTVETPANRGVWFYPALVVLLLAAQVTLGVAAFTLASKHPVQFDPHYVRDVQTKAHPATE
jgi:hypothetical protein